MSRIHNIENMTSEDIKREVENGAKFVQFRYCFSVIFLTYRNGGDIYFVRKGDSTIQHSIIYTLITVFFGWWGIPFGPIYTVGVLFNNIKGGKNLTKKIMASMTDDSISEQQS